MNSDSKIGAFALSAFFNDEYDAEAAAHALMDAGIPKDAITMTPGNRPDTSPIDHMGFLDALTGIFFHEEQRAAYAAALEQGGTLVTVQEMNEAQHNIALPILAEKGQIDLNERNS
ncbi:hypothetical protein HGP16_08365 [Rhizobium sp. P40RR-XXII]|uniref:hypothetical protein n=1 Tax=unclassified Rhizobium TaxID=2613769 RepID=UPI001456AEA8|nr:MULTISPECIES: hypothetical protein [unclassified Rhizobium]NLR84521.1 hypothetical protein [Rhizobium sp. P28RR-XV]NLS16572.1 hypothetical protein [Rhizobium sp. P40RR-XXII]